MVSSNRHTTKERAAHSYWLVAFALNVYQRHWKPLTSWKEYKQRMRVLAEVRKYRRALKREPEARQLEMVFPETNVKQLPIWRTEKDAVVVASGADVNPTDAKAKVAVLLQPGASSRVED